MTDLLLHPQTQTQIDTVTALQPGAILLLGAPGAGKRSVANLITTQLLDTDQDSLLQQTGLLIIEPIKNSIGIDQAREITKFLQLKTIGSQKIRRVIIIEDAHYMTIEAQNALLKTLEEPPEDTALILTAVPLASLRGTIHSRAQQIKVLPVSKEQAQQYVSARVSYSRNDFERAFALSRGNAGLFIALLTDKDHILTHSITDAKAFLTASVYQRLILLDPVSKDKQQATLLLEALRRLVLSTLESAISKDSPGKTKWLHSLQAVFAAEKQLQTNPNSKLLLTNLALEL